MNKFVVISPHLWMWMQVIWLLQRKPEDEAAKEDGTKKLKTVEEGAGDASTKVNGKVNGTKTSPEKPKVIYRIGQLLFL